MLEVPCGYLWIPVDTCGYLWLPVVTYVYLWLSLVICGYLWLPVTTKLPKPLMPLLSICCEETTMYPHLCEAIADGGLGFDLRQAQTVQNGG